VIRKYVWLSYSLSEKTPAYGGGPGVGIEPTKSIARGDSCNTSLWHFPNHVGTHVDAPKHFFEDGNTIDSYKPEFWIFERVCIVSVFLESTSMMIKLEHIIPFLKDKPDLLLIMTGMGKFRQNKTYWESSPGLSPVLARELRTLCPSLRAVGVDFISISSWQNRTEGREVHREFLNPAVPGSPVVLIEDMNLLSLSGDIHVERVFVLPLRVENGDGAPCTVMAEVITNG